MDTRYGFIPGYKGRPEPDVVLDLVAQRLDIPMKELWNSSRVSVYVFARALAIRLLRDECEMSWRQIAHLLDKDHSTCIYAYQQLQKRMNAEPDLREWVESIEAKL